MYATCLHCHHALGRNERIEAFPVGERLAFDARRGRLWVVCRACGRWNLSALEERWEAIEECERLFRATTRRVSTDEIGLAYVPGGLDLVRIGSPIRPEFAAWRYGAELLKRRRHDLAVGVATGTLGVGGLIGASVAAGFLLSPIAAVLPAIGLVAGSGWYSHWQLRQVVARGRDTMGQQVLVRARHLPTLRFLPSAEVGSVRVTIGDDEERADFRGAAALQLAALACARRNQIGANTTVVRSATAQLEQHGGAESLLQRVAAIGALRQVRYVDRLALEMALHEEAERRALEGELAALERAWQEAEEIAALADNLLLPESVHELLARMKSGRGR